ncbi:MAG: Rab family GTPase [Promethearchaeati archaeon SRVP18_Atabeyarchaeia-1]
MTENLQRYSFKVVVLGDWAVGKTSLIRRHAKGKFEHDTKPTIGVDITTKPYRIQGGAAIELSIWDIAGQEFSSSVRHQYYAGTSAAILVFDLTRPETFWHVKTWYVDLRDHLHQKVPVVLMGNKKDLADQKAVTDSEIRELADGYGFKYFDTSASTGENVDKAFYTLLAQIVLQKKVHLDLFGIRET